MVTTIDQIYRDNLRLLSTEAGGATALATRVGKAPAQVSQWLNASKDSKTGKPRVLSRAMARQIEEKCGKPHGWMDQVHGPLEPRVAEPPAPYVVESAYEQLIRDLEVLAPSRRSAILDQIHQAAEEAREILEHHKPGKVAAARRSQTRRSVTTVTWGDGNRKQGSLPLLVPVRDPFTAAPSEREAKFYERVESAPKAAEK